MRDVKKKHTKKSFLPFSSLDQFEKIVPERKKECEAPTLHRRRAGCGENEGIKD